MAPLGSHHDAVRELINYTFFFGLFVAYVEHTSRYMKNIDCVRLLQTNKKGILTEFLTAPGLTMVPG